MDFSQTCVGTSPMCALPIILITLEGALKKAITVQTIIAVITWTPSNDLDKLSDTQSISMYHIDIDCTSDQ